MTGKSAFKKAKWWEVSLHLQGKEGGGEKRSKRDPAAAILMPPPPMEPRDGALSTSCSRKKDFLAAPLQK